MANNEVKGCSCPYCGKKLETIKFRLESVGTYDLASQEYDTERNDIGETEYFCPECGETLSNEQVHALEKTIEKEENVESETTEKGVPAITA